MSQLTRFVLVRPERGGNVGAAARVLKNLGFDDLVLVAPRFEREAEARSWARGAEDVLEAARRVGSLQEALADCRWSIAATRRAGGRRHADHTPRALAARILELRDRRPLALVFGPERDGLTAADLSLCQELLWIPTSRRHGSLNLSQAVAIVAWELFMGGHGDSVPADALPGLDAHLVKTTSRERPPLAEAAFAEHEATLGELEGLFEHLRRVLFEIGFVRPETAEHQMRSLRRLLTRAHLRPDEVTLLRGLWRQTLWAVRHRRGGGPDPV